jgi:Ser/Thr protein kinase RdoA (MazF antagonist)
MDQLANRGLGCVPMLRSSGGNLVETLGTSIGQVHATVVAGAPGQRLDADDLTSDRARAWGAALAVVHRDGSAAARGIALADGRTRTESALALLGGDERVAAEVHAVLSRLQMLARTPSVYGLIHGDFEQDNLAWTGDRPMAYDWDEAERSWFAADIAYAVRDLVPEPRALVDRPTPLLDAFLTGYHQNRPEAQLDRAQLLLFTAVNALRSLSRLLPVLAEDPGTALGLTAHTAPGDAAPSPLRTVVERHADRQRKIASDLAALLG